MSNENKNMPELRFLEFSGKWEKKKLKDIGDIITGKTPSTSNPKFYDGNYPFVSPLDIQNHRFIKNTNKTLSEKGFYSGRIIRKDASLFVCIGSTIGKIGQAGADVTTNQQINSLIPYERYDDNFIYSNLLKSSSKIKQLAATQAIPIINKETFGSYFINLPQIDEQIKIGNFFNKLDQQIELEEQKLSLLEEQKKGYMQQIFSQKLRFKDENGNDYTDWGERYFFDNIQKTLDCRGKTPKKLGMEWSDSGYLALSALNVKNGYIDYSVEANYGDENLYHKWMQGKELKQGQVLFTTEAPMGNVAQVPDNRGYILSQRTIAFEVNNRITDGFLVVLLNSSQVRNKLISLSSGATAKGVSQKSLKKLRINLPESLIEQEKIGTFFSKFDEIVEKQNQKVELLKKLKKGFLQKMFV